MAKRKSNKVTILKESKVHIPTVPGGYFVQDEDPTDPDNTQLPPEEVFRALAEALGLLDYTTAWLDDGVRQPAHIRINQQGKPSIK